MDLNIIRENYEACIEFELEELSYIDDIESVGDMCELISQEYRWLAICKVLMESDVDGFFEALIRSAYTWKFYLDCLQASGANIERPVLASRNNTFFDALAAGQFPLAEAIAKMTSTIWHPDEEYEDDFWYAHFLNEFIQKGLSSDSELEGVLEKFYASLKGATETRYTVCKVIFEKNNEKFNECFEKLLEDRLTEIKVDEETSIDEEISFNLEKHIFVEGLAILKIAEKIGFDMQEDYILCPSILRKSYSKELPKTGYPKL